jgi:hypothetical protein
MADSEAGPEKVSVALDLFLALAAPSSTFCQKVELVVLTITAISQPRPPAASEIALSTITRESSLLISVSLRVMVYACRCSAPVIGDAAVGRSRRRAG